MILIRQCSPSAVLLFDSLRRVESGAVDGLFCFIIVKSSVYALNMANKAPKLLMSTLRIDLLQQNPIGEREQFSELHLSDKSVTNFLWAGEKKVNFWLSEFLVNTVRHAIFEHSIEASVKHPLPPFAW